MIVPYIMFKQIVQLQTAWGFKSTVIEHGLLSLKPEQIHNGPEANDKERYDTRMRSSKVIKWL